MTGPLPQLLVVMPVFNEEASLEKVVAEWFLKLDQCVGEFTLLAIDDGSADGTLEILKTLQTKLGPRFEWLTRENRGHGQSCMQGYRIALDRKIPFVLQIDSDGQSSPEYFGEFWDMRHDFHVIYGKRSRQDGARRVMASSVLRYLLRLLADADCTDANVPYRLMDTLACADGIRRIPADLFLANIGLAVVLRKSSSIRHSALPIGFPPRYGGEASVPFLKFASKAFELFRQLKKAGIR